MKRINVLVLASLAVLAAACGRNSRGDDALKNDLALAAQAQPSQQFVSPTEQGYGQPYNPYAPQQYQAVARQPAASAVRRVSTTRSSGTRSRSSGTIYRAPQTETVKHTNRDAAIGAAAGAVIGAVSSRDKVKGGLIGGAAGAILGAVIGNNVDIQRRQIP